MKKELINLINCSKCNSSSFKTVVKIKNKQEIRKGEIICQECKSKFLINKGILNMLSDSNSIVKKEQKENLDLVQTKRFNKTDDWLLSLPLASDFGNEKYPFINKGYLLNIEKILSKLNLQGLRVLDLGAGTCWTTNKLAQKGSESVAVDISSEKYIGLSSSDTYMKHNKVFFERVLANMEKLPFLDDSFDIVLANTVIHHSFNISKTFKEISRVLKKNGKLIIVNEQCCGILRRNKQVSFSEAKKAGMDVLAGWNERIYNIFDYLKSSRKAGLKSKLYFPPSIDFMLLHSSNLKAIKNYKRILGKFMSVFWKVRIIRNFCKKILYFPGLVLFGGPIIMVSKKKSNTKRCIDEKY